MQELATQPSEPARRRLSAPIVLLGILILGYAVFFGAYAVQRHNTLNTSADGISAADQAMWNTLHGRLLQQTVGAVQVPRLAQHFEPVLVPLSLVYLAWNDVRAVLILQALVLALGALPVFWIARRTFAGEGRRTEWIALAFSLAYLLYPALQAANAAGFHAETLAVTPLLFAFWYGTERRWRAMWAWAIAAILMSETVPALTAMLGLYFILSDGAFRNAWRAPGRTAGSRLRSAFSGAAKHGAGPVPRQPRLVCRREPRDRRAAGPQVLRRGGPRLPRRPGRRARAPA